LRIQWEHFRYIEIVCLCVSHFSWVPWLLWYPKEKVDFQKRKGWKSHLSGHHMPSIPSLGK
jgi:hypothetical protein